MFSKKQEAITFIDNYKRVYALPKDAIILYERKKQGKLFGRHPYCIAVKETRMFDFSGDLK
jgi:hypothetical protein